MPVTKLNRKQVEKPWGREELGFGFANPGGAKVGEIWYETPDGRDLPLLVKYLFTSEKLSIQVHPDDTAAQAAGHPRGKDEAWVILGTEPGSTIAIGTVRVSSREELRVAALDGSIETLVDWKRVAPGDSIYSAAGTVHAIGAGLTLIEVQQNVDLTYRLYDYGRPRELHLDEGVPVSDAVPFVAPPAPGEIAAGREILCEGGKFVMERWRWTGERSVTLPDVAGWLVQVTGASAIDGQRAAPGEVWLVEGDTTIAPEDDSEIVFAYPLAERLPLFG